IGLMALCSYSTLLSPTTPCGQSSEYPGSLECVSLKDCTKEIYGHLSSLQLGADEGLGNEMELLLSRAGVFSVEEKHFALNICPRHRADFGIWWRTRKMLCTIPKYLAAHKAASAKGSHHVDSKQSRYILKNSNTLIPVGSPICKQCKECFNQQFLSDESIDESPSTGASCQIQVEVSVHVSTSSLIATHCSVYALSDSTSRELQKQCDHSHEESCEQCESLDFTLKDISTAIEEASFATGDDKDEAIYRANSANLAIQSWKCHILRSTHQDQARLDIIDALDSESVFIVNDWAMKFLPQKYRESQADWFGKRGISWHISVVYRRIDGKVQWQGFIHVIQSCTQGSSAVVAIMHHVLSTLNKEQPEVRKAFFRQDNAACYHCNRTIQACREISATTGVQVARIDFSDPQGGKGAADRLAATCKGHVRAFINEGNDVCTAADLKNALLSYGGIEGIRVVSLDTIAETPDDSQTITGITKLNNFVFSSEGSLTCWRAYGIGQGNTIKPDKQRPGPAYQLIEASFSQGDFRPFTSKKSTKDKSSRTAAPTSVDEVEVDAAAEVYYCPNRSCVRVFQRYSALEKHLSLEKCTQAMEKHSLIDLAKLGYKSRLEEGISAIPVLQAAVSQQESPATTTKQGWALKAAKKAYRFNDKQKSYLQAKFHIGQVTGRKLDAELVAREMRRARGTDGVRLFLSSEFLTTSQVASFFSRQSTSVKKGTHVQNLDDMDIAASEEESNFNEAKKAVQSIELQHPLVHDQYNLCTMAVDDTIKRLKLPMLQHMCEDLGLDVPIPHVRKKAPYLELLDEITSQCTCRRK
ncbi:hypothetical protein QZH41_020586, partial [Actinostola sp. cb2023]